MIELNINGKTERVDADPATPLLWALRDSLGLTGTKFGCGIAVCGACTVHVDGAPRRACTTPISAVAGAKITTIEAIETDRVGRAVQAAWIKNDVVQCGYCQSGQVMAATALLKATKNPSDRDIDEAMKDILCRCGTYARIRAAVKEAARSLA
jgi:isoquinoline 1-oxidoreductase subunit alpha